MKPYAITAPQDNIYLTKQLSFHYHSGGIIKYFRYSGNRIADGAARANGRATLNPLPSMQPAGGSHQERLKAVIDADPGETPEGWLEERPEFRFSRLPR